MSRVRSRWLGLGLAVAALVTAFTASDASGATAPVVRTAHGLVRGVTATGVDEFLGVPYAAPPVGRLRWQPPQPAARWNGVRDATAFAPHCAQPAGSFGQGSTAEDCLYLNVFAPAHRARNLPVMVWIHGGSLVTGESDDYLPTDLVHDGVVVVTLNYRLGALGFLAHPAFGAHSGNYGLMDQQAALRWVQRNIGGFGGNARNVTIFGESAGGLSVLSQLASPGSRGLFERAIVESGSYNPTQASLAQAEASGEAFADKVGCSDQTAACLRSVPVTTLLADENTGYTPDIDGVVLTQQLSTSFATGRFHHVPVMDGTNHDEWRLFVGADELAGHPVTAANYQATIAATLGVPATVAAVIAAEYPLTDYDVPGEAMGAVGTDAIFACNAIGIDGTLSQYVPTFAYEFNDENAPEPFLPPVSFPYGAAHASELPYLFSAPPGTDTGLTPQQQRLSDTMRREWTSFAAHGVPSLSAPHFNPVTHRIQSLVPPRPTVETNFAVDHKCAFWSALTQ